MASIGDEPARISRVIILRNDTIPKIFAKSIVGNIPVLIELRIISIDE